MLKLQTLLGGRAMIDSDLRSGLVKAIHTVLVLLCLAVIFGYPGTVVWAWAEAGAPTPLLEKGHPVDWWFAFKFNAKSFPGCGSGADDQRQCPFGGDVQRYTFGQQFVYASSEEPRLQKGTGCVGATMSDPVGATFDGIYNGAVYYVVWNDQFYDQPVIAGCTK